MHLHFDDLLVEVDAAIVHHLHHPLLSAGWADLGLLNVPQDVLHKLLVLAIVALEAGVAAPTHIFMRFRCDIHAFPYRVSSCCSSVQPAGRPEPPGPGISDK